MLLLLTVGLLLIGLVTLVIGFLNSSLALDYISIAASALSFALVLLFTRLGRARSARTAAARARQAPAPIAPRETGETGVIELDSGDSVAPETATYPRTTRTSRPEPAAQVFDEPPLEEVDEGDEAVWEAEPAPPVSARAARERSPYDRPTYERPSYERPSPPEPEIAAPASEAGVEDFDDDRYEGAGDERGRHDEDYEDLQFPIAEYDELRVAEILPLLEELEPDEIEVVRDREMTGRNRSVVLRKLDELSGGVGMPAPDRRPPAPVVNGTRQRQVVEPAIASDYDDDDAGYRYGSDEEEYVPGPEGASHVAFPIADYDELRLTEILPMLPQLEPVELEMVRQRELEGERRATLLNRIDALIGNRPTRAPARQSR